jgi:hypothetical protein
LTIQQYLDVRGLSNERLGKQVGATRQTVARWLRTGAVERRWWSSLEALGITRFARLYRVSLIMPADVTHAATGMDPEEALHVEVGGWGQLVFGGQS